MSSSCDSVHLTALLFCTCIVPVGSSLVALCVHCQARVAPDDGSGGSSDRITQAVGFQHSLISSFQPLAAQSSFACLNSES